MVAADTEKENAGRIAKSKGACVVCLANLSETFNRTTNRQLTDIIIVNRDERSHK